MKMLLFKFDVVFINFMKFWTFLSLFFQRLKILSLWYIDNTWNRSCWLIIHRLIFRPKVLLNVAYRSWILCFIRSDITFNCYMMLLLLCTPMWKNNSGCELLYLLGYHSISTFIFSWYWRQDSICIFCIYRRTHCNLR